MGRAIVFWCVCSLVLFLRCSWWYVIDASFLFVALKRLGLSSDGHNRVLRVLHHREHHFKHFIRPELLALYSFSPEPSEVVLSLQEINQKSEYLNRICCLLRPSDDAFLKMSLFFFVGMATAKLNKERLKKMMSQ